MLFSWAQTWVANMERAIEIAGRSLRIILFMVKLKGVD